MRWNIPLCWFLHLSCGQPLHAPMHLTVPTDTASIISITLSHRHFLVPYSAHYDGKLIDEITGESFPP